MKEEEKPTDSKQISYIRINKLETPSNDKNLNEKVKSVHVDDLKKPFNNLERIEQLLGKIFKNEKITIEDFKFSSPEMHILVELLLRKSKGKTKLK